MLQFDNIEYDTESQTLMKIKRDQFAIEIRKKKNANTINAKRMKFSKPQEGRSAEENKLLNKDESEVWSASSFIIMTLCLLI